jgi:DNA-binding transcriptional ArsR family regulator
MSSHTTIADDGPPLARLLALRREVVRALADPLRAASLSALLERDRPTSLEALVAAVHDRETNAGTDTSRRAVRDSLALHHLPTLDGAGLVAFDSEDLTVRPTDHLAVTSGLVDHSLLSSLPERTWRVAETLAGYPLRRRVVTVLADDPGPLDLHRLVAASSTRSAATTAGGDPREVPTGRAATDLHHVHLPTLDDAGLLAYDASAHVVERVPDPTVEYDRLAEAISASATRVRPVDVDGTDPSSGRRSASNVDPESGDAGDAN